MINSVVLLGRLVADPELRYTTTNKPVASFTLAVNRAFAREQADFLNIVAWNATAEFVSKYVTKGQQVALDGRIQTRQYEDKQGNKRTAFEIVAEHVCFAEGKQSTNTPKTSQNAPHTKYDVPQADFTELDDGTSDDLPF